jgi:hypothetical protein
MVTEVRDVESKALSVVERAVAVKVTDPNSYIIAGEMWKHLAEMEKEAKAALDPVVEAAFRSHKEAVALRTRILAPITEAKTYTKGQMEAWDAEQERIRLAEERRLAAEAKRAEEEARLSEAVELEQAGQKEEAEAVLAEPIVAPVVIVERAVPKVAGGPSYRTIWDAQVVDLMALVKAVASGTVSINALKADEVFLRRQAQSLKETFKVPGCKAYSRRV